MTFRTEFPDFPLADYPTLPPGFRDSSWHHDVCPSMRNETLGLLVFIDFTDVTKREFTDDDSPRFSVLKMDGDGCLENSDTILTTDDWAEVLALIASKGGAQ